MNKIWCMVVFDIVGSVSAREGWVGMNDGGARFSVSVSPAGMNGWSGFRENAAQRVLRAQNAVFRPFFYVFTLCAPLWRRRGAPGASTMTKP